MWAAAAATPGDPIRLRVGVSMMAPPLPPAVAATDSHDSDANTIYTIKPASTQQEVYILQRSQTVRTDPAAAADPAAIVSSLLPLQLRQQTGMDPPQPPPLQHALSAVAPVPPPRFAMTPRAKSLLDPSGAAAAMPLLPSFSSAAAQAVPAQAAHQTNSPRPGSPSHFSYASAVLSRFPPRTQASAESFGQSPRLAAEPPGRTHSPAATRNGSRHPPGAPQASFTAHTRATSHPHPRDRPSYDPHRAMLQQRPRDRERGRPRESADDSSSSSSPRRLGALSRRPTAHPLPQYLRGGRTRNASMAVLDAEGAELFLLDGNGSVGNGNVGNGIGGGSSGDLGPEAHTLRAVGVDALEEWISTQQTGRGRTPSASASRPALPSQPHPTQRHAHRVTQEARHDPSSARSNDAAHRSGGAPIGLFDPAARAVAEEEEESPLQRWRRLQTANRAAQIEAARLAADERQHSQN